MHTLIDLFQQINEEGLNPATYALVLYPDGSGAIQDTVSAYETEDIIGWHTVLEGESKLRRVLQEQHIGWRW